MAPGLGYVFASACGYGCVDMDASSFRGLCDECGLLDERFTASDVDEVYVAALPADPGGIERRLDLEAFEAALSLLAERRGTGAGEVLAAVLGAGGPRMHRASTDSGFCEASRAPWSDEAASPAAASRAPAGEELVVGAQEEGAFAAREGCLEGERWEGGGAPSEIRAEEAVVAGDAEAASAPAGAAGRGEGSPAAAGACPEGDTCCACGAAFTEDSRFCRRCGARRFAPAEEEGPQAAAVAAAGPAGGAGVAVPAPERVAGSSTRPKAVPRSLSRCCLSRAPSAPASRPQTPKTPRRPPLRERTQTPHAARGPTPARAELRSRRTLGSLPAAESAGACRAAHLASERCELDDGLDEAFRAYCGTVQSGMDGKTFAKLCKDGRLVDRACTTIDVDLIFARAAPKGRRRLEPRQFREALRMVAEKKGADVAGTLSVVAALRGPALRGTKAEAVRFHDDRSTYTGTHAQGGPEAVPLGRGSATQLAALGMRLGHRS